MTTDLTAAQQTDLAKALYNRTWDLIDARARNEDDDVAMLLAACAARWHWGEVGGVEQVATSDWQVAHVASLLALGDLAIWFAGRNLAAAQAEDWSGWRLASAHEGMARAFACAGDADGRARHFELARAALENEPDQDDRVVVEDQLATVPDVPPGP